MYHKSRDACQFASHRSDTPVGNSYDIDICIPRHRLYARTSSHRDYLMTGISKGLPQAGSHIACSYQNRSVCRCSHFSRSSF